MKKFALVGLLAVALLVGCKSDPLVGKWTVKSNDNQMTMDIELAAPDKITASMDYFGKAKVVFTGTYKMEGDKFTTNFTDVSLDYSGDKAEQAKQAFAAQKTMILKQMNNDPVGTVVWDGKDKFTLTPEKDKAHPMVFTRAAK